MGSTTPNICRYFELRLDVKKDCFGGSPLGIITQLTNDVHYTVNDPDPTLDPLNVSITRFISQAPFSCQITHYEWRLDNGSGAPNPFPSDLVTTSVTDNMNLNLVVQSDNNNHAIPGSNVYSGYLHGKVTATATQSWNVPLKLYVFINCKVQHLTFSGNSFTGYINQILLPIRVTELT